MVHIQGGFKEVIRKAFPEADFSQWSTLTPCPFQISSFLAAELTCCVAIRLQARTIPRDQELQRSVLAFCTTERI